MKKNWLLFSFLLSLIPSFNYFSFQKENYHFFQVQDQKDYLYTDEEIIKEFYNPIAYNKAEPSGKLVIPKLYNEILKFQFADEDLNLIWKESLKTKLEFDLKLSWEGPKQTKKIEIHLSQFLDFESMQEPLVCGLISWESYYFPWLKFSPSIDFSWEEKNLVLEHKNNSSLNDVQEYILTNLESNGLTKMFFQITNLRLVYQIPQIFHQISQVELNLEYWSDINSISKIDQLIAEAVFNDSELKKLKFIDYFENPILTTQQKQSLLNISNNFKVDFQLLLQLKPKYQEEIFNPLLKNLHLKITFFQLIDLNQLILNTKLKLDFNDDPQQIFLNQNLNYKLFFENYCDFQTIDNYLFIQPNPKYVNLIGTLNLLIEYEEVAKKDLNELGLESDLGVFELENRNQILQPEEIFNRWKESNDLILTNEKFDDYSVWEGKDNEYLIRAVERNQHFKGSILIHLQKIYLNDEKDNQNNQPNPNLKLSSNFWQKYWWILILGVFVIVLIIWFIYKTFKDKKDDKS